MLIFCLIFPWILNNGSTDDAPPLDKNNLGSYESNICTYNFLDFVSENFYSENLIKPDKTSSIECYSKVNGIGYTPDSISVYIGTNINLDLIIQSLFWLLLFSLIPVSNTYSMRNVEVAAFLGTLLFLLHLRSESYFYQMNSKIFSPNLENNYLIFSLLITLYFVLFTFITLCQKRFYNILNYLPFIFVIVGTFNTLNLNFFVICFAVLGIIRTLKKRKLQFGLLVLLVMSKLWEVQTINEIAFFDVDKIKGFSSSAYNSDSILYWSLIFFFFCVGFIFLIQKTIIFLNIDLLQKNLLISGGASVILSIISASGPLENFFTYYYLGLNKSPSRTLESVSGNAWRGISSSAEGVGEFYAFVLLIVLGLALKNKKINLSLPYLLFGLLNIYGLYRANNFAAVSSLIVILGCIYVSYNIPSKKIRFFLLVSLSLLIPYFYQSYSTIPTAQDLSRNLIKESLKISYLDSFDKNQYGQTAIDENRFLEILQQEENEEVISNTLNFLVERYHYSERNNLPNLTTTISAVAYPINRTKVWGIFIGKYDPTLSSLLFGTGFNQIANYYFSHPTKVNTGLTLPHSAVLSYLVYTGLFGILTFFTFIVFRLIRYKFITIYVLITLFFLMNIIKSDSLLYVNNFMLFIFAINLHKYFEKEYLEKFKEDTSK